MNLFDRQFSESDLIAFHMNELPSRRSRALRRALEANPALAAEAAAIAATLGEFKAAAAVPRLDAGVLQRNWEAVRSVIRPLAAPQAQPLAVALAATLPATLPWRRPLLVGGGVAAFATLAVVVSLHRSMHAHDGPTDAGVRSTEANGKAGAAVEIAASQPQHDNVESESPFLSLRTSSPQPRATRDEWGVSRAAPRTSATTKLIPLATREESTLHYPSFELKPITRSMPLLPPIPNDLHVVPVPYTALPPSAGTQVTLKPRRHHELDLMLAVGGDFIASQNSSNSSGSGSTLSTSLHTQSATHAVMAIAAFHQQLRPYVGYRLAVSYTRPDFQYSSQAANSYSTFETGGDISSGIYEFAGTYVARGPHAHKLSTAVDAGAGLMAFLPTNAYQSVSYVYRGAAVLGINADLALSRRVSLRAGYRAQLFKSPDFRNTDGAIPVTSRVTVSSEPFVGVTYRFGGATSD